MLTNLSSYVRSIWCLLGDMFCHKKVGYKCMDMILRPASLNYVYTMIIEKLSMYAMPLESSCKTKPLYAGPLLADMMANLMCLRGANVGINGQMQLCLWP